jgi:hypothetical protein
VAEAPAARPRRADEMRGEWSCLLYLLESLEADSFSAPLAACATTLPMDDQRLRTNDEESNLGGSSWRRRLPQDLVELMISPFAEEKVKRERQGAKERVAELEQDAR